MSRTERLLDLLQILRSRTYPIAGRELASMLGISLRSLYRDIVTLQGQGAAIEGEAGLGYVLRPGFLMPPLMFTQDELEALMLGAQWVVERGDVGLGEAAESAMVKIAAVLPDRLRNQYEAPIMAVGPHNQNTRDDILYQLRKAMNKEVKAVIEYVDANNNVSSRTIWPIIVGFFESTETLAAWCEARNNYRHFRLDRIRSIEILSQAIGKPRHQLLHDWKTKEKIDI